MSITSFVKAAHQLRFNFQQMVNRHLFPQMQVAFPSSYMEHNKSAESNEGSIFDNFLWFAAPKSKISPGRKKEKHGRFYPKRVNWIPCDRCGEAKLPHKICTKNAELCSMREKDWLIEKKNRAAQSAATGLQSEA